MPPKAIAPDGMTPPPLIANGSHTYDNIFRGKHSGFDILDRTILLPFDNDGVSEYQDYHKVWHHHFIT
ncbi:MAG: hypothetical protein H8E41_04695 [Desulfobulbaceae bacterium]|uniref:Uncharacterized protein n=1 Tax=Candidatus Desulfobia pelagia TaxID=2841692 RepID=A0A8J6TBS6_9BACT|nr:hypothetical protein [Candidatus Desulfobia pelagia]